MTYETMSGRVLTATELDALADEVEHRHYDVEAIKASRRGGRPAMGSGPAELLTVRLEPELRAALDERVERDHSSVSEVVREALRRYVVPA